jgi:UDP-4-amino-4,6-dideoxy-N-acetyl-beta-L-altrosamine N-acetyltransferase
MSQDSSYPARNFDYTQPAPPYSGYGVTLTRLAASDLELVRSWRNSPEIRDYMVYREYISEEMQRRWFASINNRYNFYSVIHYEGQAIGLSHTKNVDWHTMTGEGGMMIWSKAHQNSNVPFLAALLGTDWMFQQLGMNTIVGRVLKTNKRALRYDRALGYVFDPPDADSDVLIGRLTADSYQRATAGIRVVLTRESAK